jgi:predicted transport protein
MADIKLFKVSSQSATELKGTSSQMEKSLQATIERDLVTYLGVQYLATEYATGANHGGRIDTLGIDENGSPVIIEYKRTLNENVINQGLFYLDWLMDHKAEFELLVLKLLGQTQADRIDWAHPRLLCIAGDFTRYDEYAVKQINRNIELIRYKKFGDDLLMFELVNVTQARSSNGGIAQNNTDTRSGNIEYKTVTNNIDAASTELRDLYHQLRDFLLALGDDVQEKTLKYYIAFKRLKNFACVEVYPQSNKIQIYVKINPDEVILEKGFTRDVRNIGHFGTGDLEITIRTIQDMRRAEQLLLMSYEGG